jgi:hypothetical protein
MQDAEHIREHKRKIDSLIKAGIDNLLLSGEVKEEDFFYNELNEKMIKINDQEGVEIVFNYTRGTVYSYGNRLNND